MGVVGCQNHGSQQELSAEAEELRQATLVYPAFVFESQFRRPGANKHLRASSLEMLVPSAVPLEAQLRCSRKRAGAAGQLRRFASMSFGVPTSPQSDPGPQRKFLSPTSPPASERSVSPAGKPYLRDVVGELEEMYDTIGLDDEDLFFRSERRDMPACFQLSWAQNQNRTSSIGSTSTPTSVHTSSTSSDELRFSPSPVTTRSSTPEISRVFQQQRTPSYRRNAIPDRVMDDLAYRKLVHRNGLKSGRDSASNSGFCYLHCSPLHTPALELPEIYRAAIMMDEPDIEKDDMSYRKISQAAVVPPPQPRIGIPLKPSAPSSDREYLHVKPFPNPLRSQTRPQKMPDLVRDDLAVRTLRKDINYSR